LPAKIQGLEELSTGFRTQTFGFPTGCLINQTRESARTRDAASPSCSLESIRSSPFDVGHPGRIDAMKIKRLIVAALFADPVGRSPAA
jgi:hypothetical protein